MANMKGSAQFHQSLVQAMNDSVAFSVEIRGEVVNVRIDAISAGEDGALRITMKEIEG